MPLNLQANTGDDFVPYISYNAKAGRWFVRTDNSKVDIEVVNPVLAFDFANIKTGWIYYPPAGSGSGPEKVWDPAPGITAAKPAGQQNFKRGFEVMVHGPGQIGVREFSSTAGSTIGPILEIFNQYERDMAANRGKVPVFACTGVTPISGKLGTNYSPVFKLQQWVERALIPFDSNGQAPPQPAGFLTLADAVQAAAPHGITREFIIGDIRTRGGKGWMPDRDSPVLKEMIRKSEEMRRGTEQAFDDGSYPTDQDTSEIPF